MAHRRASRTGLRPFVWSAAVCTALCLFVARPAYAEPAPPGVPDAGSRPTVTGALQLPGADGTGGVVTSTPTVPSEPGPLGQQIMTESIALETAGQQLRNLDEDLAEARRTADTTRDRWTKASGELSDLHDRIGHEAGEAYKAATALGPLDGLAGDLHQLSVLAPGVGQQPGGPATALDLERAEQIERAANTAYLAATAKVDDLSRRRDTVKADFDRRTAALTELRTRNAAAYQQELAAIDAQQAALGAGMNVGGAVDGWMAAPVARRAVDYARSKLGRPYVWGAEGPNYFDCSGLVLWSYQQASGNPSIFPRVANDQYWATSHQGRDAVAVDKLLPGDLLFFATDKSDWRSVHHVGMYLGNGYMIHAPTTGDVVKISPIWWSEFYKATRVVPAVRAPSPSPTPPPAPPASTPPSTPPSSSPPGPPPTSPSTPPSKPPSPSLSPSKSPSASASSAASPSPTPKASSSSAAASTSSRSSSGTPKP